MALQCPLFTALAASPVSATATPSPPQAPGKQALAGAADEIDWEKARGLHRRSQGGEKLTAEEDAYLNRAVAARNARPASQRLPPRHLTPLTDMGASDRSALRKRGVMGGKE